MRTIIRIMTFSLLILPLATSWQASEVRAADALRTLQPAQKAPMTTRTMAVQPVQTAIRSAVPSRAALSVTGGSVTVNLSGSNLNLISSVQILLNGRSVPDVTARLGSPSAASRQLTLTARSGAPPGSYQVRLIAGSQTITLSASVLTAVVQAPATRAPVARVAITSTPSTTPVPGTQTMATSRIQPSPTVPPASLGSSGSGDGVAGVSPLQMGVPKQASDTSGQKDGFPVQGSVTDQGDLIGTRGTSAGQFSARTGMVSRQSVPVSQTPPKLQASPLSSRVRNMTKAGDFKPRELQPIVNRVAVAPEDVMAQRQAGTMNGSQFNRVVSEVFSAARFDANACGGSYQDRKIVTSIPNTFFEEAVGALGRLNYELTDGEKKRATYYIGSKLVIFKREHVRACVDNWNGRAWTGAVEGGRFLVRIGFENSPQSVTARALDGDWDWNSTAARNAIPDYWFNGLVLDVLLTPRLDGNLISYSDVDARWSFRGGDLFSMTGRFLLEENKQRIINYKDGAMEKIRGKIIAIFRIAAVRNRVAEAVTTSVTANQFVNRVTALTGDGDSIAYDYE